MTQYSITCYKCKKVYIVELTQDELDAWNNPELLIQEALPNHTSDERELIKTHKCGSCFNDMFKNVKED